MEFFSHLPDGSPPQYADFWRLWARCDYFACHEVLEDLWRREKGPKKPFYQGLIHCAVALYQAGRGNAVGASRQLVRARHRLAPYAPECEGVRVEKLLEAVESEVATLRQKLTQKQRDGLSKLAAELERAQQ